MHAQRHIIQRQIIELTVPDTASAPAIQAEISRIYRQRIVPLIEQYCSELGQPDRVYRIDSLELDLGSLAVQDLEEMFVSRIKVSLPQALTAEISSQEADSTHQPKTQSALELFALFARTGTLPWWADHHHPGLLADNLRQLLRAPPAPLIPLLQSLMQDADTRQRLATQYDDQALGQLCGLLVPAYRHDFTQETQRLIAALQRTPAAQSWPPATQRQRVWSNCLQVAALGGQEYPALAAFYHAVLERVAAELGVHGSALINASNDNSSAAADGLRQRLTRLQRVSSGPLAAAWGHLMTLTPRWPAALRAQLQQALHGAPEQIAAHIQTLLQRENQAALANMFATALAAPGHAESELAALLRRRHSRGGPLAPAWAALRTICERLAPEFQAHWLAILLDTESASESSNNGVPDISAILRLLGTAQAASGLRPPELARLQNLLPRESATHALARHSTNADELSINNAGLVILWPFLTGFFNHMGLLDGRDFKDLAARQRGAGLLQVLATPETGFPEYLLPLNKLLCGLEADHPFDFGPPLRRRERRECNTLLEAVIAQAPILNNMPPEGFQGSFLLRPGLLTIRDGHWLLRVERQTYDIVLERMPWNWEWIKLPWMEAPLRVEWSQHE
jgi:hypothetical protein